MKENQNKGAAIEALERQYKIGQEIFEQIFEKSDKLILEFLKDILPTRGTVNSAERILDTLSDTSVSVHRNIRNEKPHDIEIYGNWNLVSIDSTGISFKAEHGKYEALVYFTQYFKLPETE